MISRTLLVLVAATVFSTAPLRAQTYNEIGDAGQTLGSAQATGGSGTLTVIAGSISSGTDADLYFINITAPTTFSASTVGGSTLDTALFLFNGSGVPIYTNDDFDGFTLQSRLPAGTTFTMSLSPGIYFIGISLSGNESVNLSGQFLFAGFPSGDSTAVRGPAAGVSPNTHSNFNGQTAFAETGAYQITLTSTARAVPEPATSVLAIAGGIGLLVTLRRRVTRALS